MNVLLVDDELPAVEGTVASINWGQLGIEQLFTAFSFEGAQKIFDANRVDILICDIEMPEGSGIDLLHWVRIFHPETEAIFLTAHADFKYAQQAIQLGCVDYVLKPVESNELGQILNKAISLVNQRNETLKYRQYGTFWLQNKPLVFERFWLDIINGTIPSNREDIHLASTTRSVYPHDEGLVLPILIKIQRWYKSIGRHEENQYQSALRDLAEDILTKGLGETSVFPVEVGILVAVSEITYRDLDMPNLKNQLESLIHQSNKLLSCDISAYVGEPVLIIDLHSMMARLKTVDQNNVNELNTVFLPQRNVPSSIKINLPDFNIWSRLMVKGLNESLHEEANRYQQFLKGKREIDAYFLIHFHQDFLQMVHVVLQAKGIKAHQLFNDQQTQELSKKATRMTSGLFAWVHFVIDRACNYINDVERSDTILDKVIRYISQNISEELTREDIANFVYLNPDYLSRIVKKETGMTLMEYIQNQRMILAKELLEKTDMPVSEIAMQVGYMHFSQFSKIFKKYMDVTPIKYRYIRKQKTNPDD